MDMYKQMVMKKGNTFGWCWLLMLATLTSGCGGPSDHGEVQGLVTVDGSIPESGAIAFTPASGSGPTAGGRIVDGKYSVQVPLGTSKVAIRVPKVVGEKKLYNTPDSPVRQTKAESLPSKYNDETELTLEVVPGENEHNFELSTTE